MTKVFTRDDCVQLQDGENYEKKFVILTVQQFKPEYQNAKNQLFFAQCGFGCYPDKLGGKVFGRLFDEDYQTRREYILGVAKEEAIVEWEQEYGMSREIFLKKGEE